MKFRASSACSLPRVFLVGSVLAADLGAGSGSVRSGLQAHVGMIQHRGEGMLDVRSLSRSLTHPAIVNAR